MLEFNRVSLFSREKLEQSLADLQVTEALPKRVGRYMFVAFPGKTCLRISKKARDIYLVEIAF